MDGIADGSRPFRAGSSEFPSTCGRFAGNDGNGADPDASPRAALNSATSRGMRFVDLSVEGSCLVQPVGHQDARGSFSRVWCRAEFAERGLSADFVQCNEVLSLVKGTLRGLHYQVAPFREIKLLRCLRGAIFAVVLDLRPASTTFHRWHGVELTAAMTEMLYVPEGCALGYLTLTDGTDVLYPVSQFYTPAAERGVRWNDPLFSIRWPAIGPLTISAKDQAWPDHQP